ncbi:DMT family transporter [Rhodobacterales bacterium]|nr:DMT family transporter [Rhodobacterales bacterium]
MTSTPVYDCAKADPVRSAERKSPHPAQSRKLQDNPLFLLLTVGIFLAVSTVFAKAAPTLGWHPLALLQWSILGGAAGLFLVLRLGDRAGESAVGKQGRGRAPYLRYLLASGLFFIVPNMIAVTAAPRVGAGFVSLCYALPMVLTYGLAVSLKIERFQRLRATGVLFGLAGGLLLALSGRNLSADASFWSFAALAIPFFLAGGNIYRTMKWPDGARPEDLAVGMMVVGFVALLAFNAATGVPLRPEGWQGGAIALLLAQIAVFGLQYGLYFRLQYTAGPVYLSQLGSVAAVAGLGFGYFIFGEVPNEAKLAAVLSVAAGVVLVTVGRPKSPR